jgi:hypothetical protein
LINGIFVKSDITCSSDRIDKTDKTRINSEHAYTQQQHSSQVQLGQSFGELLFLHSEGRQLQSAHFMDNKF